jgi:hypothetical protein
MKSPRVSARVGLCAALLMGGSAAPAADHFGDIVVTPESMISGDTHHGYRELRVLLENESAKESHQVTLIYPDRSYEMGNCLSRLSRTVSLGPGARVLAPLWEPPLPCTGDGNLRVEIDGETAGRVAYPDAARHFSRSGARYYGGGGGDPATVLVSRTLNYDQVVRAFKSQSDPDAFSAMMATGPPDTGGRRGRWPKTWCPDDTAPGPAWLELNYDPPLPADKLRIYDSMGAWSGGEMILQSAAGTNLARFPLSSTGGRSPRGMSPREFSFALTSEPVKTVRLEFGSTYAGGIAIDAVELSGPSGSAWASGARASSEQSPSSRPMPGMETVDLLKAELPGTEWSANWLSYTPYDLVVLDGSDAAALPPVVMSALWQYAECGGNLLFLGGGQVPEPWAPARRHPSRAAATTESAWGSVSFTTPGRRRICPRRA